MVEYCYDVFISYSSIDKLVAEAVCGYLESHRIRCFVAYRDIRKGEDWAQAIPPALHGSHMMLAVFSNAFNISEQTDNELHLAARQKMPILTFRISDDDFVGAKEYFLAKSNWIDAFPEPEKQFGELLRSVALLLDLKGVAPIATMPRQEAPVTAAALDAVSGARALLYNEPNKRDPLKAVYLLRKAAREGFAEAQFELSRCCRFGWGTPQSWAQTHEWLTKAARQGYSRAQCHLAKMHHYAIGCQQDIMQALTLYTDAAESGDGPAAEMLGYVYHTGELGVQDEGRSREWYIRALDMLQEQAFEDNDSEAMRILAWMYHDGMGVTRDEALCVEWLRRASGLYNSIAINDLYLCYWDGAGVPKDEKRAMELLRRAADMECRIAQANLALRYQDHDDIAQYKEYILCAANGGDASSQAQLAVAYEYGWEPYEQNAEESERWYARAIESGSLIAMHNYGVHLENAEGANDKARAVAYYKRAALLGYPPSLVALGRVYYNNRDVEENDINAERWYRRYLELFEQAKTEGRTFTYAPSGLGGVVCVDFKSESYCNMLVQCCKNLAWLYRYSKTVEHDEREAGRLEALAEEMKQKYL